MRIFLSFILFFTLIDLTSAQQILESATIASGNPEFQFNKEFIRLNKIRSIQAFLSNKPDNEAIKDKGLTNYYEYNEHGNIIKYYYTRIKSAEEKQYTIPAAYRKGKKIKDAVVSTEYNYLYDTITTWYFYDVKQNIKIKRTKQNNIYNTWYYEYDEMGRLSKQGNWKETNIGSNDLDFKPGMQTKISSENFEYIQQSDLQTKQKCYNDEQRVYKEIIRNYSPEGKLLNETHEFIIGWIRMENKYSYDEKGRLIEKLFFSNTSGDLEEKYRYQYDDKNNLLAEEESRNQSVISETNNLYDEKSNFIKSSITRNFPEKEIRIIKYSYGFF